MKIAQYGTDSTPSLSSKLIGTDTSDSNATKNFEISAILALLNENTQFTPVLSASSTINQTPSGLDVPLQVSFGPAQGSSGDAVMIDAAGTITFNEAGLYLVNGYGNVERRGSSGGSTVTLFRFLVNGSQSSSTKGFELTTTDVMIPYELTTPINITTPGTTVSFEIMRDSSGNNGGGLYTHTNLGGWPNVPSAEMNIWKLQ